MPIPTEKIRKVMRLDFKFVIFCVHLCSESESGWAKYSRPQSREEILHSRKWKLLYVQMAASGWMDASSRASAASTWGLRNIHTLSLFFLFVILFVFSDSWLSVTTIFRAKLCWRWLALAHKSQLLDFHKICEHMIKHSQC